jgi:hypothetical protein
MSGMQNGGAYFHSVEIRILSLLDFSSVQRSCFNRGAVDAQFSWEGNGRATVHERD